MKFHTLVFDGRRPDMKEFLRGVIDGRNDSDPCMQTLNFTLDFWRKYGVRS